MQSFGESDILEDGVYLSGRVRVLGVRADQALSPRLRLTVGVQFQRTRISRVAGEPAPAPGAPSVRVELRDLAGELHIAGPGGPGAGAYAGAYVGRAWWAGAPRVIPALPHSYETSVELACDLSPLSLARLEDHRGGGPLRLTFTPRLGVWQDGRPADNFDARQFDFTVPQERWLETLAGFGAEQATLLELRVAPAEAVPFRAAAEQVREAGRLVDRGANVEAVAKCRLAYELLLRERPEWATENGKGVWRALAAGFHERAAPHYERFASTLKQLTALTHHGYGADVTFTRTQARFVVTTTAYLLAVLGEASAHVTAREVAIRRPD